MVEYIEYIDEASYKELRDNTTKVDMETEPSSKRWEPYWIYVTTDRDTKTQLSYTIIYLIDRRKKTMPGDKTKKTRKETDKIIELHIQPPTVAVKDIIQAINDDLNNKVNDGDEVVKEFIDKLKKIKQDTPAPTGGKRKSKKSNKSKKSKTRKNSRKTNRRR